MASSSSSSSVTLFSTVPWKYDVFLSFRGVDTRTNFTDHLYAALHRRGIITFRDDVRLERGEEIELSLFKAIKDSRFAIVILSKTYADSTWCLDELAKIVDCKKEREQILPVFYDVSPSEVEKQTGGFGVAFDKHDETFKDDKKKVQNWRSALTKVAYQSGWDVAGKSEYQIVADIVDFISSRQQPTFSTVLEGLVGMDSRLKELKDYLTMARDDVKFIGIHGMGGIGKTTMARVLFDMFKSQYDGSCFLANIREVTDEKGLIYLQKQLLFEILKEKDLEVWDDVPGAARIKRGVSCKKVFLVLDDVDQLEQLEKLAGKHDWFGHGSIIIITTRDEKLLKNHGVNYILEVKGLYDNHARKLLFLKAFKRTSPTDEHFALAEDMIRYAKGLPLAIEVLGGHMRDEDIEKWKDLLERLKEIPDPKIIGRLRISYDGLQDAEKKLFLDIACFFKGKPINSVANILEKYKYGIKILKEKSLIKISDDKLWMHDLTQEMGWKIVLEEHPNEPGRRSRLWTFNDFNHLVTIDTATKTVEGIMVDVPPERTLSLNGKIFSSMYNLRLLKINNVRSVKDLTFLSNNLWVLEWRGYPGKFLPSSFEANHLVELKMSYSYVEYLWKGVKWCEMLKTIQLCHSSNLTETPDFSGIPILEWLDLEGCIRLRKVHESVGILAKLIELNLKNCKSLVSLPSRVSGMKSLKILNLFGCSKLKKLPCDMRGLECLEELDVSESSTRECPYSIIGLRKWNSLSVSGIGGMRGGMLMPKRKREFTFLNNLQNLKSLNISGLNLEILPDSLGSLSSLELLYLTRNNFVSLPASMSKLSKIAVVVLDECKRLQSLNGIPSSVYMGGGICARGCTSLGRFDCSSFLIAERSDMPYGNSFDFSNCTKLLENQSRTYDEITAWMNQWIQGNKAVKGEPRRFPTSSYHILVPGSNIPYWINIWNHGDTFIMEIPHRYNNKRMVSIFCAIIQPNEICDPQKLHCSIRFEVISTKSCFRSSMGLILPEKFKCDHLVLSYQVFEQFGEISCRKEYAQVTCKTEGSITVKRLGVRLVNLEDPMENMEVLNNIERVYEPTQDETDLPSFTHRPLVILTHNFDK